MSVQKMIEGLDLIFHPLDENRVCSFCGKSNGEVELILAGEHACICNECVDVAAVECAGWRAKKREEKADG